MFSRLILGLSIVAGLWMLTPTPEAEARGWRRHQPRRHYFRPKRFRAPELDPGTGAAALVLVVGGVAYIASRRRKEEDLA